jgi:hypothetical protein
MVNENAANRFEFVLQNAQCVDRDTFMEWLIFGLGAVLNCK